MSVFLFSFVYFVFSLKNDDFLYIAEEIVKIFLTEATTAYYIPSISKKFLQIGKYNL